MPKAITSTDLRNLFQNPFNLKAWTTVLKNLFCADEVYDREPEAIETPSDDIEAYSLGWLNTSDTYQIALLYYRFKSGSVVRRKVGLRQLANSLAKRIKTDAALAVFDDGKHWRLSFICDLKDEKTSPKRFTFVFGDATHQYHTAVSRFIKLQSDRISFKSIREAFSVEALSKEFYTKLYNWYEWALGLDNDKYPKYKFNVTFPNDPDTSGDDREETSLKQHLIRLITRLIFIWFIKQKGLIASELFDVNELKKILKDFDPLAGRNGKGCKPQEENTTNYYHAILQNLFFATLNKAMNERAFTYDGPDKKKRAEHYTVKTFYRYEHDLTDKGKDKLVELFKKTPFLNGGLFECLDTVKDERDKKPGEHSAIHRDGFSRDAKMNGDNFAYRAFIPNILFFNDDDGQPGLITLLKQYNFTVEENTPDEEQVALDPELLGKIFENLLASYNPETAQTARKATGSYYTPREIVHYMAEQSIAECLKTKLKDKLCHGKKAGKSGMTPEALEKAIDELMQGEVCPESLKLARADIETELLEMKILDPACGSGAFPMGVMQVMLNILSKIKENYSDKQHDYKLKIIQNCLYGVDIQPIAVQIAKLRCFITLIVDETPDNNNPNNLGITILPNLETKFVCANTLIPLNMQVNAPKDKKQLSLFDQLLDKVDKAKRELWAIREAHFRAKSYAEKKDLREKDEKKREELKRLYLEAKAPSDEVEKLLSWNPYDQTVSNGFFDPEWMLGVSDGFDVVIGNPPYLESRNKIFSSNLKDELERLMKRRYPDKDWFPRGSDLLVYFFEFSIRMLKTKGINAFITQNSWLSTESGKKFQRYLIENTNVYSIIDSDYKYFETANINTVITFLAGKNKQCTDITYINMHSSFRDYPLSAFQFKNINKKFATFKAFNPREIDNIKWCELAKDDAYLEIINLVDSNGKFIDESIQFSIGQGLNLEQKKRCIFSLSELKDLNIPQSASYPFYNKLDGANYCWNHPNTFIVNKAKCSLSNHNYLLCDFSHTTKEPPVLILPRGIGDKHYCCYNAVNGYSDSYVDIYSKNGTILTDDVLRLWIYLNSSIFWLIRENSGRTNLGGGMLKAEAIDIKSHAILFNFEINDDIRFLFESVKNVKVKCVVDELNTRHHQQIDAIVFNYLGFNDNQREYVLMSLRKRVLERNNKSKCHSR